MTGCTTQCSFRSSSPTSSTVSADAPETARRTSDARCRALSAAAILCNPQLHGYPLLPVGAVKHPKFGYIFVESRLPGVRRPKLVDGYDWVPSSTANASSRVLCDGETELLRFYCARRTKSAAAKPLVKAFVFFQREYYDEIKEENPGISSYALKRIIGERWRALSDEDRRPYQQSALEVNRDSRRRMALADPAQLLVRHEMCLTGPSVADDVGMRVLVHYLGDDAFQRLTQPPRPMRVTTLKSTQTKEHEAYSLPIGIETARVHLFIGCCSVAPTPVSTDADDEDGVGSGGWSLPPLLPSTTRDTETPLPLPPPPLALTTYTTPSLLALPDRDEPAPAPLRELQLSATFDSPCSTSECERSCSAARPSAATPSSRQSHRKQGPRPPRAPMVGASRLGQLATSADGLFHEPLMVAAASTPTQTPGNERSPPTSRERTLPDDAEDPYSSSEEVQDLAAYGPDDEWFAAFDFESARRT